MTCWGAVESHLYQIRPQSPAQARSPRWVELILIAVKNYLDVDVLISIVVEFPLDEYGTEIKGVPKTLGKQSAHYTGNAITI